MGKGTSPSTPRRQVVARKVQILQQVKAVAAAAGEAVLLIRSREIRNQRTDDRVQRSEVGGRKSEGRGQLKETRLPNSE